MARQQLESSIQDVVARRRLRCSRLKALADASGEEPLAPEEIPSADWAPSSDALPLAEETEDWLASDFPDEAGEAASPVDDVSQDPTIEEDAPESPAAALAAELADAALEISQADDEAAVAASFEALKEEGEIQLGESEIAWAPDFEAELSEETPEEAAEDPELEEEAVADLLGVEPRMEEPTEPECFEISSLEELSSRLSKSGASELSEDLDTVDFEKISVDVLEASEKVLANEEAVQAFCEPEAPKVDVPKVDPLVDAAFEEEVAATDAQELTEELEPTSPAEAAMEPEAPPPEDVAQKEAAAVDEPEEDFSDDLETELERSALQERTLEALDTDALHAALIEKFVPIVDIQKLPKTKPNRVIAKSRQAAVKRAVSDSPVSEKKEEESPKPKKKKRVSLLDSYFKGL